MKNSRGRSSVAVTMTRKLHCSAREWSSLFSGKYFAMLVVFADETGTGGIQKGREPAPGVCGFVATPEMWENFRTSWKTMLKKHKDASVIFILENWVHLSVKSSNPYHGWDEFEVDDFHLRHGDCC